MNISKFTQKSVEAVQGCEKLAYEYGNQQIDQEHLLVSLLRLEDSLIMKLVTKMGISGGQFLNEAEQALNKLPKVSGGGQVYLTTSPASTDSCFRYPRARMFQPKQTVSVTAPRSRLEAEPKSSA